MTIIHLLTGNYLPRIMKRQGLTLFGALAVCAIAIAIKYLINLRPEDEHKITQAKKGIVPGL